MKLRNILAVVGTCAMAAFSMASRADVIYQITSDHCTGSGGCLGGLTSAGTITVTQNGTNSIHFAISLAAGFTIVNTGFDGSFAFNLAGNPTVTYSNMTVGFTQVGPNPTGAQNLTGFDGFGSFEYAVLRNVQGGGSGLPSLSFDLAGTGLTANLSTFEANATGAFFVVDVRGANGNTGLVDASLGTVCTPPVCTPQAPEPATLALLGIALLGMSVPAIRRRRNGR